jgi:competence protein ComEA
MKKQFIWLSMAIMVEFAGVAFAAPVDINNADATLIAKEILGVGPKIAQEIITYREQNGPFTSIDDLVKIKGISQKMVDTNRANITLGEIVQTAEPASAIGTPAATSTSAPAAKPASTSMPAAKPASTTAPVEPAPTPPPSKP